jgi:hypothetical protein
MYTVRYAHLKEKPGLEIGQLLNYEDKIGIMGNTGQSTGAHLHIDCVLGEWDKKFTLADMAQGLPKPEPYQLNFFIDFDLFKSKPIITTWYCDYTYQQDFRKLHPAYDIIPSQWDKNVIYWNRSVPGKVILILDDKDYGHCVHIAFSQKGD